MPREHMLVDAVDERAVKIKKKGWSVIAILIHGVGASEATSLLSVFDLSHALLVFEQGCDD